MGFFDKLFGGKSKDENTAKFTNQSKTVLTPLQGKVLAQADIPDETFAQGILGPGCGIEPTGDTVYAPFDGTVTQIATTLHAVGITSNDGIELLIHVGMDTVDMKGQGFTVLVKENQKVTAGTPLLKVDLDAIRAAGWDDTSAPVLTMTFPGNRSITFTATEIGFDATPDAAAETAYAYGRSGNVFTNFFTWLRCAFKGHDVASDNLADMDADALRTRIEREAAEINVSLSAGSIEIDEAHSAILVVKGASMITLDPAAVADRMLSDIRAGKFGTSAYPVDMSGDDKMTLQELHDAICGDPVNAGYDPETQSATESKVGIEFDVAEAQPLWDAASTGDTVTIPATLTQPEMTQERLQQHLLADKLATKTTSLSGSSSNRITNVKLAAEKINGVILQPGQTFSYNDVVGQRTKANGFKEAGAYSNGQVVQEVGGGICQVSSTLYYCAMVSNLKINTRTCHYFPVAYIEPGMDATVSWGGPEFKFTNSREYPIEIKAYVEKNSITVEIWGTDVDGSYVKMSYTANGLRATTYRTVYDKDGNEISRTVEANSTYHSHDTTPVSYTHLTLPTNSRV